MVLVPISTDLQKSYRDTLIIPAAPSMIDTDLPIQPVAVIATTTAASTSPYMRLTDGTNNLSIASNGTLLVTTADPRPVSRPTMKFATARRTTAGTSTIFTTTAGKTAYVVSIQVSIAGAGNNQQATVTDASSNTWMDVEGVAVVGTAGAWTNGAAISYPPGMEPSVASNTALSFTTTVSGTTQSACTVVYYEV